MPSVGELSLIQPLSLLPAAPVVGDLLQGSFAIRNSGGQSITLKELAIDGRGPDCDPNDWDCTKYQSFGHQGTITLAPGEEYIVSASSQALQAAGAYFYQIVYQNTNDMWVNMGDRIDLNVSDGSTPSTATSTPTNTPTNTPTSTPTAPPVNNVFYVAPDGDNNNPGTIELPWKDIQYAADNVPAGSTVNVRAGTYHELVTVNVSGSSEDYIKFQSYPNDNGRAILDGSDLNVSTESALFKVEDQSYIIIKGFEIKNYKTSQKDRTPIGILIQGTSTHIQILDNHIHHIENTGGGKDHWNAHGIAVFGRNGNQSVNNIIIDGNKLYDLVLGSSEALVLNGNVEEFEVTNNSVHDVNNIAIDVIGWEGTAPQNDQARDGLIRGNTIYNVSSFGNPAYGNEYSAGGIYIDGGRDVIVEQNTVHAADYGIELASEHQGRATSNITVRNNFIYHSNVAGIAMGGYQTNKGSAENCKIVNNTLFSNDQQSDYFGEIYLQYNVQNSTIKNNIFVADADGILIRDEHKGQDSSSNVTLDNNLYYVLGSTNGESWTWRGGSYGSLSAFQGTGNAQNSLYVDPQLASTSKPDLHLTNSSPAIDRGTADVDAGPKDIDDESRIIGAGIDIGADEADASEENPTKKINQPVFQVFLPSVQEASD